MTASPVPIPAARPAPYDITVRATAFDLRGNTASLGTAVVHVESDFDGGVQNKGKESGEWLTTVVGKGGASVTISTFSGPVSLRKR